MKHLAQRFFPMGMICLLLLTFGIQHAQAQGKPMRVRFRAGASSATLRGRIVGYAYKDYVLRAGKGQTMSIQIEADKAQFVLYSINGEATEMVEQTDWTEQLAEDGDYVIRVLMMRTDARRKGATDGYALKISIK